MGEPFRYATKWYVWVLGLIVVFTLIGTPVGLALGWFNRGAQVVSSENVSEQWRQGYDYYNALKGTAQNVCTYRKAAALETPGTEAYNQRQSQVLAQQTLYETNSRKYNAFMQDPLRAKLVKPNDLPAVAPTEPEMEQIIGCSR